MLGYISNIRASLPCIKYDKICIRFENALALSKLNCIHIYIHIVCLCVRALICVETVIERNHTIKLTIYKSIEWKRLNVLRKKNAHTHTDIRTSIYAFEKNRPFF